MTKTINRLEHLLDKLIERKDIHSAVLSVASGDGTFRWAGARGAISPGGAPMTTATPWFIASITKLFIASTVLRMVEDGELALDDRLVDRLPASVTHRLHVLDGVDRTDRITVEHLLGHASGLADYIEDYPTSRRSPWTRGVSVYGIQTRTTSFSWGSSRPGAARPSAGSWRT